MSWTFHEVESNCMSPLKLMCPMYMCSMRTFVTTRNAKVTENVPVILTDSTPDTGIYLCSVIYSHHQKEELGV